MEETMSIDHLCANYHISLKVWVRDYLMSHNTNYNSELLTRLRIESI